MSSKPWKSMKNHRFFCVFAKSTISSSKLIFLLKTFKNHLQDSQMRRLGEVLRPFGVSIWSSLGPPWPSLPSSWHSLHATLVAWAAKTHPGRHFSWNLSSQDHSHEVLQASSKPLASLFQASKLQASKLQASSGLGGWREAQTIRYSIEYRV